jgi:hypothetical protein
MVQISAFDAIDEAVRSALECRLRRAAEERHVSPYVPSFLSVAARNEDGHFVDSQGEN